MELIDVSDKLSTTSSKFQDVSEHISILKKETDLLKSENGEKIWLTYTGVVQSAPTSRNCMVCEMLRGFRNWK